ncbi:toxin [Actinomadura sp. CNU-125]|uniref:SRPBCC family protein n=1 Tax=Actinomadura sp. CNU-125 TaxID=1904961 RepID=UPI0009689AD9|nr:SRPBCC family protein [Actinomadura sp. CNU-125]OLT33109.1 toxin [Actinomadura sp. CNU-125]
MTVTTGDYLTTGDGRPAVRFVREYDHPIERVWRAVTDADELAHWFPSRVDIELRAGGTIRFSGDPNLPESTGRVLAVEVPRHLVFTWGDDELRFDLEPVGAERTRFTFTHVLAATDTAARNAAGWEVCLAFLDARIRGETLQGPHAGASAPWEEHYNAYIAAGVPSGAPVPGVDDAE